MSVDIRELIDETTKIYRPGPAVTEREIVPGVKSIDVWIDTPHESEAPQDDGHLIVDVHFFRCAVNLEQAEAHREKFYELCDGWPPDPMGSTLTLDRGPSYIVLGAQIGTVMGQDDALRLMALGEALGCWEVITPRRLLKAVGTTDEELDAMQDKLDRAAGSGYVMISGYKKPETV